MRPDAKSTSCRMAVSTRGPSQKPPSDCGVVSSALFGGAPMVEEKAARLGCAGGLSSISGDRLRRTSGDPLPKGEAVAAAATASAQSSVDCWVTDRAVCLFVASLATGYASCEHGLRLAPFLTRSSDWLLVILKLRSRAVAAS